MSTIQSFNMPITQLGRQRTVWVYLPTGYEQGNNFPVIYMQDGQNCFYDDHCAYGNSWRVAQTLDEIDKLYGYKAVVVAVESKYEVRLSEYSPWKIAFWAHKAKSSIAKSPANRGGEGRQYAEFFAQDLPKEIARRYKVQQDRRGNAVVGSSMGGLISCYLGLAYPSVYSDMGLFSTYTEFNQAKFNAFIGKVSLTQPMHAYVYCGGKEGDEFTTNQRMQRNSVQLYNQLNKLGVDVDLVLSCKRPHNELSWRVYFYNFALDFLRRYYTAK